MTTLKKIMANRKATPSDLDPLIGFYFHTFNNGQIEDQGQVIAQDHLGAYKCEHFSWWGGYTSGFRRYTTAQMTGWRFYETAEQMRAAWDAQS